MYNNGEYVRKKFMLYIYRPDSTKLVWGLSVVYDKIISYMYIGPGICTVCRHLLDICTDLAMYT